MKQLPLLLLASASVLVAADQPEGPRPERRPEARNDRRPEGQPQSQGQANQPTVIPLPRGLPPGAYMLVPLPQQPGQPQGQERPNIERPNIERPNLERPNVERPNGERPGADRPAVQPREGQGGNARPAAMLTPDEQAKVRAAMEKANQDSSVKEARENAQKAQKALEEARLNERKATEAAALKVDPSLEPIFDKIHKAQQNQQQRRGNEGGERPNGRQGDQPAR